MSNRWVALALLFFVRTVMAFQFQTVAALSPFIEDAYGVGLAAVGFLFGLFMAPGLFLAIPGGALARSFGEKRVVIACLWLMALGLVIMSFVPGWTAAMAGRVIAGIGGILMNIIITKMAVDWFEGKELATAMSILIVSWPTGIALALIVLPPLAASAGLTIAMGLGAFLAVVGALGFMAYKAAPNATATPKGDKLDRKARSASVATGLTWGFLNAALAVVFGFGVALLADRSIDVDLAGQVTSLTMIALAVTGPVGGMIADKTGRYISLIAISVVIMALCLAMIAGGASGLWLFILFGAACGLCAGPVMSLPGLVLRTAERSRGMGLFFTVYYAAMLIAPPIAGFVAQVSGNTEGAFHVGILFCGLTLIGLFWTQRVRGALA